MDEATIWGLVEAVIAGDIDAVRQMVDARPALADMTVSYGDEHRAIHYAVIHRRPEIARLLMQRGANARAGIHPHRDATKALTLARERGYEEIVAIIEEEERLRRQQNVTVSNTGVTEEVVGEDERAAVARGDLEWLRARFAAGALENRVRWDGGGLMTVAVKHERIDVLRFLLDCGFDPNERASYGHGDGVSYSQGYPLWHAAALGRREMAELLLDRGADPNVHMDSAGSPVYSAFSHKQWDLVELLLRRGGIVTGDIAAIYRRTDLLPGLLATADDAGVQEILRFGADGGAVEVVRMALEKVDWARDDPRWFGPLTSLMSFWHHIPWLYAGNKEFDRGAYLDCFRLLLTRCDVNVTGGFGRAVLHEIAAMGDWITDDEVAAFGRVALEAGARTDRRDHILESTPLGWACRWGRAPLVRLLVEHGADVEENDAPEWARPREWARKMGHESILRALE